MYRVEDIKKLLALLRIGSVIFESIRKPSQKQGRLKTERCEEGNCGNIFFTLL